MTKYIAWIAAVVVLLVAVLATYYNVHDSSKFLNTEISSDELNIVEREQVELTIDIDDMEGKKGPQKNSLNLMPKSEIDNRMKRSLEHFKEKMAAIEPGAIEREREEIEALREESEARTIEPPMVEVVVDEYGNKMKKYTYENGIVRYGLM